MTNARLQFVGYVQSLTSLTQEERDAVVLFSERAEAEALSAFKWDARGTLDKVFA